jgi:hypothetical protein
MQDGCELQEEGPVHEEQAAPVHVSVILVGKKKDNNE